DRLVDDLEPAVRRARVVDEPRDVAPDVGVAAPGPVDAKHPDAAVGEVALLALLAFVVAHQLAGVVDDPRVLRDPLGGKDSEAVNGRSASDDLRQSVLRFHAIVQVIVLPGDRPPCSSGSPPRLGQIATGNATEVAQAVAIRTR